MIVKIVAKNPEYPDLSEQRPYFVIGVEADDFRVLNDSGKPYLYPPEIFSIMDSSMPDDWVTEYGEDGERYSYPAQLNTPGFFEDLFDQEPEQTSIFWQVVNQQLAHAA